MSAFAKRLERQGPPLDAVVFQAQMVAMGAADVQRSRRNAARSSSASGRLHRELLSRPRKLGERFRLWGREAHGDATVLIFKTEVEEARRAAPLFRAPVSLTAIGVGA